MLGTPPRARLAIGARGGDLSIADNLIPDCRREQATPAIAATLRG